MNKVWWQTIGKGEYHLVLLHGWGLNAEIWNCISMNLSLHFTLHLVDLPGFGRSCNFGAMCIKEMAEHVLYNAPDKAIWLGWSLGGLVASQITIEHPERVQALVTVASSPCFRARGDWPGIRVEILSDFQRQLNEDFRRTVERFLDLQTRGIEMSRHDMSSIREDVLALPIPGVEVLIGGLEILKNVDLRKPLANLPIPHLRIYGYLDRLVPYKIATVLDEYWPKSKSLIIRKASHALFISHPKDFCDAVVSLSTCANPIFLPV